MASSWLQQEVELCQLRRTEKQEPWKPGGARAPVLGPGAMSLETGLCSLSSALFIQLLEKAAGHLTLTGFEVNCHSGSAKTKEGAQSNPQGEFQSKNPGGI